MVTHSMEDVAELADHVIILERGRALVLGPSRGGPSHPVRAREVQLPRGDSRWHFGQYYSADSPFTAWTRASSSRAPSPLWRAVSSSTPWKCCCLAGAAVFAAIALARVPLRRLLARSGPSRCSFVITSVINLFLVQTGPIALQLGHIVIHADGVSADGSPHTVRFFLLLSAVRSLTLTTTPVALADAAEKLLAPLERVGIPVHQGTTTCSPSRCASSPRSPKRRGEHRRRPDRSRGRSENKGALAYARACVPLIVPLFASALRHADNLGRAMDARCYTGGARTHYHVMKLDSRRDGAACLALTLYSGGLPLWRCASHSPVARPPCATPDGSSSNRRATSILRRRLCGILNPHM